MKNKSIVSVIIIIIAILIIPIPLRLKDGGTVIYKSLIYKISDVHRFNTDVTSNDPYIEGIIVEVLGIEVLNSEDKYLN